MSDLPTRAEVIPHLEAWSPGAWRILDAYADGDIRDLRVIPDEVVEAAANVLAVVDSQHGPADMLSELKPSIADSYRGLATQQLTAALDVWRGLP